MELNYQSLTDSVTDWIADQIITGKYPPRSWLTETEIADTLQVSRSPVREALRRLSLEGLVSVMPRRGTFVAPLDAKDADDLYACRIMLEPTSIELAVNVIDAGTIANLRRIFATMEEAVAAGDHPRYLEANMQYHRALSEMCPNRVLAQLIEITWRKVLRYRYIVLSLPDRVTTSLEHHRKLTMAIEEGEGLKARNVATAILHEARQVLLEKLRASSHGEVPEDNGQA